LPSVPNSVQTAVVYAGSMIESVRGSTVSQSQSCRLKFLSHKNRI
jgi:hypothetical protein